MENNLNSRLYSCEVMKENINGLIIAPPSVRPGPDNKNCPEIRPGQLMELSLAMFPSKDSNLTYAQNWNIA